MTTIDTVVRHGVDPLLLLALLWLAAALASAVLR